MGATPIIALDFPDKTSAEKFLLHFQHEPLFVKVGMELFYKEGASFVEWIKAQGHQIFLDLKLHDIPNTVYRAMKVLATLGVDIVNVHAAGGSEMMRAALQGLQEGAYSTSTAPKLIAVTQLTSTNQEQMQREQLINHELKDSVLHYAQLAYQSGLDGVVCSALEAAEISKNTNANFLRVTPGIRLLGDDTHDQQRIVTPKQAREMGSSQIVIGRSITLAKDPYAAYEKTKLEWELKG